MAKQLFPKEFINTSLEHYTFRIRRKSNAIYLVLVLLTVSAIAALPLTSIDVSVSVNGQVGTKDQRHILTSPVSGMLTSYNLNENKIVVENEILLRFDPSDINQELELIDSRINNLQNFISDLSLLIDQTSTLKQSDLSTSKYQLVHLQYISALEKLLLEKDNLKRVHGRQKSLFDQKVIAAAVYETDETNYERAKAEIEFFKTQSINSWKQASLDFGVEKDQLLLKKEQLLTEQKKYTLVAPGKGELQNVSVLRRGQFIQAGLKIAELSPDTLLIATCWVPPKDIGLLKKGMTGTFRIHAFNFNEWGFLKGKVKDISSDVYVLNGQPVFRVECELEKSFLSLKNGFEGKLKKGMTFQSNFQITTRTLYQLLYDKVDDWLNPNSIQTRSADEAG